MKRAKELCPELLVLHYDFPLYEEISRKIYEIFFGISDIVQPLSVDEAFIELCVDSSNQGQGTMIAEELRYRVRAATGCDCSVGIGPNMLLARLATRKVSMNMYYTIYN